MLTDAMTIGWHVELYKAESENANLITAGSKFISSNQFHNLFDQFIDVRSL